MKLNKKNKLLIVGFITALIISYSFAFSNTIAYYTKYNSQKSILGTNVDNPALLEDLQKKQQQLNEVLKQYTSNNDNSFQNELLKELNALSEKNNLKIIDFKEPHIITEEGLKTKSYTFSLQGTFNEILLTVSTIENNPALGYVKHISFTKKKNYKTNTFYLTCEVILQVTETVKED